MLKGKSILKIAERQKYLKKVFKEKSTLKSAQRKMYFKNCSKMSPPKGPPAGGGMLVPGRATGHRHYTTWRLHPFFIVATTIITIIITVIATTKFKLND